MRLIKSFSYSLDLVVDNEYEAAEQLNKDIESIHQWSQKWLIKFNPDKTEIMTISKNITNPTISLSTWTM
jgi:nitrogen fixation protein FixH